MEREVVGQNRKVKESEQGDQRGRFGNVHKQPRLARASQVLASRWLRPLVWQPKVVGKLEEDCDAEAIATIEGGRKGIGTII